ncbi:MAG: hypothetical protein KGZ69_07870 [Methylomonas sp.]|nr:hypothetical protein [Methylomonas sp.]
MARIRTIKPEFWKNEDLSALPESTHILAAALLNYADDEGFFNANPALIKAECFPIREPSVSVPESLQHLSKIGFLQLGGGEDGKRYGKIVNFLDHQKISHPTPSKINEMEVLWEASVRPPGRLRNHSALKGKERKGKEQGKESCASFDAFWNFVIRKIAKPECEKIYRRIVDRGEATEAQLLDGIRAYAEASANSDPKFICHPKTWLNQGRWTDVQHVPRPGVMQALDRIEREYGT